MKTVGARVNEIDLLRFLAAMSVVLFHYAFRGFAADGKSVMPYPLLAPLAKYGYLGVELFFMISGFVILMTAAEANLRGFLISRVVRLYPAFWACCTLTFLAILAFGSPVFHASMSQYLINLTMLSGFIGVSSIDGAYWSLFVEMQFYAFVSLVLVFRKIHHAERYLWVWLVAVAAVEMFPNGKIGRLLIQNYAAYFIAGAAYYLIMKNGASWSRMLIVLLSWVLAVSQQASVVENFYSHYRTALNVYVVVGIISAFFVVLLLVALRKTGGVGRISWVILGALTYPLYLVHQYIGFMVFNNGYPRVNSHVLLWGMVALSLFLAYVVHTQVEKRFASRMKNALNLWWDQALHLRFLFK
ncbi:acyltransferase family protein [Roseateles albus]|uniref:Acyltransferase n=1 Tax=Roseateles albus TaxID=2987525 RepID=A0ABT5KFC0_9BURK|nr:acyltransferase [Roseateles albus]MDC8772082.1 acyltransferase [Roseateles albus]